MRASGRSVLAVSLGQWRCEEEFVMVPDEHLAYEVVLGDTFFTRQGITLAYPSHIAGRTPMGRWELDLVEGGMCIRDLAVELVQEERLTGRCRLVEVRTAAGGPMDLAEAFFAVAVAPGWAGEVDGESGVLEVRGGRARVLLRAQGTGRREVVLPEGTKVGCVSTVVEGDAVNVGTVVEGPDPEDALGGISLDHLSPEQQGRVKEMLRRHGGGISQGDHDIGRAGVTSHRIELYDTTPIRMKPRRFSEPVTREVERQCTELLELGVIRQSKSPWSAPVVPIWKKDGTLRLCIDYRRLNQVTKPDRFPMPNLTDMVFGAGKAGFFTTLDLVKGYYQIPLDPASSECTAFSTPNQHYEFVRLSFGLRNAPSAFQREMAEILRGFPGNQVVCYIDDILILGDTFEAHLELVERVLTTLEEYGMKVKAPKCSWVQEEVEYLGHVISRAGIKKSPAFVSKVLDRPRPVTVKELRSFLGLVNFQRKFVPGCSVVSKPLTVWMSHPDRERLVWSEEMVAAHSTLVNAMKNDLQLSYPNYDEGASPLELSTDASSVGAGACLVQCQDGVERTIAYASTTFNRAQANYSVLEQELAAIRWAVAYFRPFLIGVPFKLRTDHRPLVYMANMSRVNSRMMRTLNELAEYNFEIEYRPGKMNVVADLLSRLEEGAGREEEPEETGGLPRGLRRMREVRGGGDSLVTSLWEVLSVLRKGEPGGPGDPRALRELLAADVAANPDRCGVSPSRKAKQLAKLWRLPGHLPPVGFISAFCDRYCVEVWVHQGLGLPLIHRPDRVEAAGEIPRVHLEELEGVHFNPLIEEVTFTPPRTLQLSGRSPSPGEGGSGTAGLEGTPQPGYGVGVSSDWRGRQSRREEGGGDAEFTCAGGQSGDGGLSDPGRAPAGVGPECRCSVFAGGALTTLQLDGPLFCALVDTGAQVSLLRESLVAHLSGYLRSRGRFDERSVVIRSVTGEEMPSMGLVRVSVRLGGVELGERGFVLVPDGYVPVCAIVGADLIRDVGLTLDFAEGGYSLHSTGGRREVKFCRRPAATVGLAFCLAQVRVHPGAERAQIPEGWTEELVRSMQARDGALRRLRELVRKGVEPRKWKDPAVAEYKRRGRDLRWRRGMVVAEKGELVVPAVSFERVVECALQAHHCSSHPGRRKLQTTLERILYHPALTRIVRDICLTCPQCQRYKSYSQVVAPPVNRIETEGPFELVAADLLTLPRTPRGHTACLVVVDHWSKWATVAPLRDKRSQTVAGSLKRMIPTWPRVPGRLLSDNGPEFVGEPFENVLASYGIGHCYSTPYHPASNGLVERVNRTLLELIRCETGRDGDWDEHLPRILVNYNHSVHSSTGQTPSEALLGGSQVRPPGPILTERERAYWRAGHRAFQPFQEGSRVLKQKPMQGNLATNKVEPRYEGPYRVGRVQPNGVSYLLKAAGGEVIRAHHSQLRQYREPPEYLQEHPAYARLVGSEKGASTRWVTEGGANWIPTSDDSAGSDTGDGPDRRQRRGLPRMVGPGAGWDKSGREPQAEGSVQVPCCGVPGAPPNQSAEAGLVTGAATLVRSCSAVPRSLEWGDRTGARRTGLESTIGDIYLPGPGRTVGELLCEMEQMFAGLEEHVGQHFRRTSRLQRDFEQILEQCTAIGTVGDSVGEVSLGEPGLDARDLRQEFLGMFTPDERGGAGYSAEREETVAGNRTGPVPPAFGPEQSGLDAATQEQTVGKGAPAKPSEALLPTGPQTRSRGPVPDLANVQDCPLEYRLRRAQQRGPGESRREPAVAQSVGPPHTRSRGPVPAYPNVQGRILERRSNRRKRRSLPVPVLSDGSGAGWRSC